KSAWLKKCYPAEFYCALLNNQPMGFYSPEVIVRDARRHGVEVLPADINKSNARCTIEDDRASPELSRRIRLGLMYVKEVGEKAMSRILTERESAPYLSLEDFYTRTGLERKPVESLILAGAFDYSGYQRRQLLWQLGILEKKCPGELTLEFSDITVSLPDFTELEEMKVDYRVQGLSTKHNPMQVVRRGISGDGLIRSSQLSKLPSDARVRLAGYVITRQRPPTAKGFAFMTLEDEDGMVNVIVRPQVYKKHRQVFKLEPLVVVEGTLQKRETLNIIAETLTSLRDERKGNPDNIQHPANPIS
ncbi:MAG: OB-fold nucleic acid binding domain-containing protein, partial [Dehalococcoidia bacterium]